MGYFPLFMDLENKDILVIGGGLTSLRKVEKLLMFNANITVISKDYLDEFYLIPVKLINKSFEESDINNNYTLVIGATNNKELNKQISNISQKLHIPVNIVDDKELCTFIFPSLYVNNDITIGISSGGKSPIISQYIRKEIEQTLPNYLGEINDEMGVLREKVKALPTYEKRKQYLQNIFNELLEDYNEN